MWFHMKFATARKFAIIHGFPDFGPGDSLSLSSGARLSLRQQIAAEIRGGFASL